MAVVIARFCAFILGEIVNGRVLFRAWRRPWPAAVLRNPARTKAQHLSALVIGSARAYAIGFHSGAEWIAASCFNLNIARKKPMQPSTSMQPAAAPLDPAMGTKRFGEQDSGGSDAQTIVLPGVLRSDRANQ